jgi:DNA primase
MAAETTVFNPAEVAAYYRVRAPKIHQRGKREWRGACPIHKGTGDNFSVEAETGRWYCHSKCGRGGDLLDFEMTTTGSQFVEARAEVFRIVGRSEVEQRPKEIVQAYDYTTATGELLYQVVRFEPKGFAQRRPDGAGGWVWKKHPQQVLYRLREIIEAPIVICVEGERDVETLRDYGFVATTIAGGCKAPWLPQFSEVLRGKEVILIPDNDPPGKAMAARIAKAIHGHVAELVYLELDPGVKDITDWFAAGRSEVELISHIESEAVSQ